MDSAGDEFWYIPKHRALAPSFPFQKWTKLKLIDLVNRSSNVAQRGVQCSIKGLSNRRFTEIMDLMISILDAPTRMKEVKPKFSDIRDGFEFVNAVPPVDHEAFLCRETGVVSMHSESSAEESPVPDDIDEPGKYVSIPHKNDLGLGKPLALEFTAALMPEAAGQVRAIFSRAGAYGGFKDLLVQHRKLDLWYEYERRAQEEALRKWCALNRIKVDG